MLRKFAAGILAPVCGASLVAACVVIPGEMGDGGTTGSSPLTLRDDGNDIHAPVYCALMIDAFVEQVRLMDAVNATALPALDDAIESGDMAAVGAIGANLRERSLVQRERLDDAASHIVGAETAAHEGRLAMIDYIDSYLLPLALALTMPEDPAEVSRDVTELHARRTVMRAIDDQEALAPALATYTVGRCRSHVLSLGAG